MKKAEQLATLTASLRVRSLRPPPIPCCVFREQSYNLLHMLDLIIRNQPACDSDDDDYVDEDIRELLEYKRTKQSAKVDPIVKNPLPPVPTRGSDRPVPVPTRGDQPVQPALDRVENPVPQDSKPPVKTLLDLMKERQQAKVEQEARAKAPLVAPSLPPNSIIDPPSTTAYGMFRPPLQQNRVPLGLNRVFEVEICYTTGPDDFYVRTREVRADFDALSGRMNEYVRKDRRPASARTVAKRELVAMQNPTSQEWMRARCVQMPTENTDDIIVEFVDSGERLIVAQDEAWLLHEMTVGELFDVVSAPSACIHCRLLDRNVTEDMWVAHLRNQESLIVWMIVRCITDDDVHEVELLEG